jgi:hypothetical protein
MRQPACAQSKDSFRLHALNGFILGIFVTCTVFKSGKVIVFSSLLFIGFTILNLPKGGFSAVSKDWFSRKTWIGSAFILFNLLVVTAEQWREIGGGFALKGMILEGQLLLLLAIMGSRYGIGRPEPFLKTIAMAFVWFGLGNLLADQLGLDPGIFDERRGIYESRFAEGEFRWIAPFYSSAQLSSLLRWALPVLALALLSKQSRWGQKSVLLLLALPAAYLLKIIEFRASIFPLLGFVLWRSLPSYRTRGILSGAFLSYMFAAPLIFTSADFRSVLEQVVPDFVLRIAGKQDVTGLVSLTDRTEIWEAGIESLRAGNYLFYGKGHVYLDAYSQSGLADPMTDQLGGRIAFHQGFLDLIFIYGFLPALALSVLVLTVSWRGVRQVSRNDLNSDDKQCIEWALFGIGMLGLTNMHDGFFNVHMFFYVIAIVCLATLNKVFTSGSASSNSVVNAAKCGVLPSSTV